MYEVIYWLGEELHRAIVSADNTQEIEYKLKIYYMLTAKGKEVKIVDVKAKSVYVIATNIW